MKTLWDLALLAFIGWLTVSFREDGFLIVCGIVMATTIGWSLGVRTQRYWDRKGY